MLRRVPLARALTALVAVAACLTACTSTAPPTARPAAPTPIGELNTVAMRVPRIDFCTLVPAVAVRDAVGTEKAAEHGYTNGQRAAVPGLDGDVSAEHGCTWTSPAGAAVARAWLFARPVHRPFARSVVRQEAHQAHCRLVRAPAFGTPDLTQVCHLGRAVRVRHAGLFGDTWLSCEVEDTAGQTEVRRRADAWCVEIANTLNMTR